MYSSLAQGVESSKYIVHHLNARRKSGLTLYGQLGDNDDRFQVIRAISSAVIATVV